MNKSRIMMKATVIAMGIVFVVLSLIFLILLIR